MSEPYPLCGVVTLAETAKVIANSSAKPDMTPRVIADGLAKLMVLIARDVETVRLTGRTFEMIEADACIVMYAILDGSVRL